MKRLCLAFGLFLAASAAYAQVDRIDGKPFATRSAVLAQHGMVCTSQPLATQIGVDVLKAGGSAVDAAIAANAALGLMEPMMDGVGGDLFAIVYDAKTKKLYGLNASGRSPLGLSLEQMQTEAAKAGSPHHIPPHGFLPISVPGAVSGWFELHGRFGRLPMKDDLAPAIRYAEEGFPVPQYIAGQWAGAVEGLGKLKLPGAFLDVYAPGGRAPAEGEVFRNPALARTLRLIAEQGRDAFYQGEIADTIDAFMRANGGFLRKVDFERHAATWVDPVSVTYRGYNVYELPPNSQGLATLQILNILEGYDLRSMGFDSPDALHVMIEAKKLAYEDRAKFYADPTFAQVPVQGLISKAYAAERRKLIRMDRAARSYPPGNPALDVGDTIYLCTGDAEGNMVSLIQSNYRGMGSGICVPGLGFAFQDRGELFALDPHHANAYAPGKRPFQTIIPGFVMKDGEPWEAFGVMGGDMQPQGHVQVLINQIDFGMDVQEAGDAARWRHADSSEPTGEIMTGGGSVQVESGTPYASVRALIQRGHDVRAGNGAFGGYQAIRWDARNRVYHGASESRKDGCAMGY